MLLNRTIQLKLNQNSSYLLRQLTYCSGLSKTVTRAENTCESNTMTQSNHTVVDTISLTPEEKYCFDLLLQTREYANTGTTLRAAGGWVRDKLLGHASNDIDIALDNIMGSQFAEHVRDYQLQTGHEALTVGVIPANPQQSKHLETATIRLPNGIELDFVNLRSETYTEDSRIPEMIFGTPEQDAIRRDFTINSLFFVLNDGSVEDWSKQGLQDLRDGIIRTPLEPRQTFLDDPLRVLRGVRFGSRYSFKLTEDIITAAQLPEVHEALSSKVSRERIGKEVLGMLTGRNPLLSIKMMYELWLLPIVFELPQEPLKAKAGDAFDAACLACAQAADATWTSLNKCEENGSMGKVVEDCQSSNHTATLLLAACLLPLRYSRFKRKKEMITAHEILRDKLRVKVKTCDEVASLHSQCIQFMQAYVELKLRTKDDTPDSVKSQLGRCVKRLQHLWPLGAVLAPIITLDQATPLAASADALVDEPAILHDWAKGAEQNDELRLSVTKDIIRYVQELQLEKCYEWKPALDGKQVMKLTGLKGRDVGSMMDKLFDWQLANPKWTSEQAETQLDVLFKQMQQSNDSMQK